MKIAAEIGGRVSRLVEIMAREQWDAVIASLPESVFYLSGALIHTQQLMRRRQCAIVVTPDGPPTLIVAEIELPLARRMAGHAPIQTYGELTDSACSAAAALLSQRGRMPEIVAIEKSYLPILDYETLKTRLPGARFVGADEQLMALRRVKSGDEQAQLAQAAQSLDRAIADGLDLAAVGMREDELAGAIAQRIHRLGGGSVRQATGMVASGENLLVPHHHADGRRLRSGDAVKVAARAIFNGYYGQLARMVVVGKGSPAFLDRYARSRDAHRRLLDLLKPGVPAESVYQQVVDARLSLGLQGRLVHVGHSMGLEYMESPRLAPGVSEPLQAGMVLQATTVTNDAEAGLIQIVDMALLEPNGARVLSDVIDTEEPTQIELKSR